MKELILLKVIEVKKHDLPLLVSLVNILAKTLISSPPPKLNTEKKTNEGKLFLHVQKTTKQHYEQQFYVQHQAVI